jgi:hypothetical protein
MAYPTGAGKLPGSSDDSDVLVRQRLLIQPAKTRPVDSRHIALTLGQIHQGLVVRSATVPQGHPVRIDAIASQPETGEEIARPLELMGVAHSALCLVGVRAVQSAHEQPRGDESLPCRLDDQGFQVIVVRCPRAGDRGQEGDLHCSLCETLPGIRRRFAPFGDEIDVQSLADVGHDGWQPRRLNFGTWKGWQEQPQVSSWLVLVDLDLSFGGKETLVGTKRS